MALPSLRGFSALVKDAKVETKYLPGLAFPLPLSLSTAALCTPEPALLAAHQVTWAAYAPSSVSPYAQETHTLPALHDFYKDEAQRPSGPDPIDGHTIQS